MGRFDDLAGLLQRLRVEPLPFPGRLRRRALEQQPIMQPRRAIAPEFDLDRRETVSTPILGPRDVIASETSFVILDRRFESAARRERTRLLAGPGANLAPSWPGGEISVAFGRRQFGHGSAESSLTAQGFPVEERGSLWPTSELAPLGALDIRVKDEAAVIRALAQDHPRVGQTFSVHSGERHCFRIVDLRSRRLFEPKPEQRDRVFSLGKVNQIQRVQSNGSPRAANAKRNNISTCAGWPTLRGCRKFPAAGYLAIQAQSRDKRSISKSKERLMSDDLEDAPVPAKPDPRSKIDPRLLEILVCPVTRAQLSYDAARQELISSAAQLAYPIRDGAPIMLPEEARKLGD